VLRDDACLWETVHSFLDQDIDESIMSGEFVKFVECDDVVWNVRKCLGRMYSGQTIGVLR
jgi:hypothetical protein